LQPNVGDVGYPELIDPRQLHPTRQVEIDFQLMIRIRSDHERFRLHPQQVVFSHDARNSFVVDQHASAP
jgi:hypothetical protein